MAVKGINTRKAALPGLFLGAAGIAFAPIFVRLSPLGPSATAFWRILLALPVFIAWHLRTSGKGGNGGIVSLRGYLVFLIPGLFFAGDLAVWHWSILFTTVANATLLANFAPVFVTLGAFLLFRKRPSLRFLFGMILGLCGATLLMKGSLNLGIRNVKGDALGILTAVFYGGYILSVNRLRRNYSTPMIMAFGGAACAAALLVISVASGEGLIAGTWKGWLVLFGLAMVSQVGGQGLIAWSLAYLPAPFASVSLLLQPVLAALFGWMILGEALGAVQAAGGMIILTGILLSRSGSKI